MKQWYNRDPDPLQTAVKEKLAAIKAKLAAGRDTCLLFDTPSLVRNLEDLYRGMWNDLKSGKLPKPDLRNLDIYHEIGAELDLENIEMLTEEAYAALYQEKLEIGRAHV